MTRRRLAAWSLGPTVVALAIAAVLLVRWWTLDRAVDAYERAEADSARAPAAVERFEAIDGPTWFDRELPALGAGSSAYLAGELARARAEFTRAIELAGTAERRCMAVVNLVLTIEAQGDEVLEIDPATARELYVVARREVDTDPACRERRDPDGRGAGDRLDRAVARLDEKLTATEPPEGTEQRPVSPEQTGSDPSESAIDELDRALDDNADARSQGPELEEGAEVDPAGPRPPQW